MGGRFPCVNICGIGLRLHPCLSSGAVRKRAVRKFALFSNGYGHLDLLFGLNNVYVAIADDANAIWWFIS